MKFFIDTADVEAIRSLYDLGIVDGVTTNPSLIAASGRVTNAVIEEICSFVEGPVSAEVIATDSSTMIEEGRALAEIADNVVVKVPLTRDGIRACKDLSEEGIIVNTTLCFSSAQAIVAAKAGARFVSPFIGRLDDINLNGTQLIADIRTIYDNYQFLTEILAASVRSINHLTEVAAIGVDVVTAPPKIIEALVDHPLTKQGLNTFLSDWQRQSEEERLEEEGLEEELEEEEEESPNVLNPDLSY